MCLIFEDYKCLVDKIILLHKLYKSIVVFGCDKMTQEIKHVAIIMDGNRRFAQSNGMPKTNGHKCGRDTLNSVLDWCKEFDINILTIYAFSIQNFERSDEEKEYLFSLLKEEFEKIKNNKHKINMFGLKVNFLGRLNLFPKEIQDMCKDIVELTKSNSKYFLNVCLGYGGREEIIDAVKKIVSENVPVSEINENMFSDYLYCSSEPDLVIRTSGEIRTSNFLPWQTVYSEWFFLDKTWPEFSKEDFIQVLKEFKEKRKRRFGK